MASSFTKFFTKSLTCPEVAGSTDASLFGLWKQRVRGWYLEPLDDWPKTGHEAFVVLLCIKEVFGQVDSLLSGPVEFTSHRAAEWIAGFDGFDLDTSLALAYALEDVGSGALAMSQDVGISGTGKPVVVTDGGVVVFDPWVILGQVREWFDRLGAADVDIALAAETIRREILGEGEES